MIKEEIKTTDEQLKYYGDLINKVYAGRVNSFALKANMKRRFGFSDEVVVEIFKAIYKKRPIAPWGYGTIVGKGVRDANVARERLEENENYKKDFGMTAKKVFEENKEAYKLKLENLELQERLAQLQEQLKAKGE